MIRVSTEYLIRTGQFTQFVWFGLSPQWESARFIDRRYQYRVSHSPLGVKIKTFQQLVVKNNRENSCHESESSGFLGKGGINFIFIFLQTIKSKSRFPTRCFEICRSFACSLF